MFRHFRRLRKLRAFLAAIAELERQTFTGLVHEPQQVNAILQGAPPPSHWCAAIRPFFPSDAGLQGRIDAYEVLVARRCSSALLQNEDRRRRLNDDLQRAQDVQSQSAAARDQATQDLHQSRSQALQRANAMLEKRNQQRVLQKRILVAGQRAGLFYLLAGGTLAGETVSLASASFACVTNPDPTQQIAVWSSSLAASLGLGYFAERGLRPIFTQSATAKIQFSWRSPIGVCLVLTICLAGVIAAVRTISAGEGGASDIAQFFFSVLTIPVLALLAGALAALGTQQLQPIPALRQQIEVLEEERGALDAGLEQMDIEEHDQGATRERAASEYDSAVEAEQEAVTAKEALLQSIFVSVVESPELMELKAEVAREAATLACLPTPAKGISPGCIPSLLLVAALLPALSGCTSQMVQAFGGTASRQGVAVLKDPTPSVTGGASFNQEVVSEHQRFLRTATEGSHFEVWTISTHPGMPALLYQFTMPRALPRDRKALKARSEAELRTALDRGRAGQRLPWSSVLEDSYRLAERLGSLPVGERRLVVMSDLQQHSPRLRLSRILETNNPRLLVEQVTRAYPPLRYQPTEVALVTLPGAVAEGRPLTPAEKGRLTDFWSQLWAAWNAPRLSVREPTTLSR